MLDLLLTKEEWVRDVKVKGRCSYSDHEMVELRIPKGLRQKAESITSLGLRRADFSLLGDQEEYRYTAQFCRDRVRKAKAWYGIQKVIRMRTSAEKSRLGKT